MKKNYSWKNFSSKNSPSNEKCYKYDGAGHIAIYWPNKKDKEEKKKKNKFLEKEKNGTTYLLSGL